MPTRLRARYEQAYNDPDLLVLRSDIAIIDARLSEVLERVDSGESGALWRELTETWQKVSDARAAGDTVSLAALLGTVNELIQRGSSDVAAWDDVRALIKDRIRAVESERKRYVEMGQLLTAEAATVLMARLAEIVAKYVPDRSTLAAICNELAILAGAGGRDAA
jgi:hypothetical protein